MSLSGHASSAWMRFAGNFRGSACMCRVRVGKLFLSTTESTCCPSMLSLIAS